MAITDTPLRVTSVAAPRNAVLRGVADRVRVSKSHITSPAVIENPIHRRRQVVHQGGGRRGRPLRRHGAGIMSRVTPSTPKQNFRRCPATGHVGAPAEHTQMTRSQHCQPERRQSEHQSCPEDANPAEHPAEHHVAHRSEQVSQKIVQLCHVAPPLARPWLSLALQGNQKTVKILSPPRMREERSWESGG